MSKENRKKLKKIGMLTEFNQFKKQAKSFRSSLKEGDIITVAKEPNRPCCYQRGWTGRVIDPSSRDPVDSPEDSKTTWVCLEWLTTPGRDMSSRKHWFIERECVKRI
jgi:hypothetical protein